MKITIENVANNQSHVVEIDDIGKPTIAVQYCDIRTEKDQSAKVIVGLHNWNPVAITASKQVCDLITECYPLCNIKYKLDNLDITLDTVYMAINNKELYHKHAHVEVII
jgi:hypothetical protein